MTKPASATPIRDLSALKEQHPEAYTAWVAEGVAQERDRIQSHLQMAKLTPAGNPGPGLKLALKAIVSGEPMSAELMNKYTQAAVNQRDIDARAADEKTVATAADRVSVSANDDRNGLGAQVVERFEKLMGVTHG